MTSLQDQWDAIISDQPDDWSALGLELRLADSEELESAGLLICPLNPWHGETWRSGRLRFRAARTFGYGAAAELVRAMLARLDADGIAGELVVLDEVDAFLPVATQGPVF